MGGSSKTVTTGYWYNVGLHFAIAQGSDCYDILKMRVGEKYIEIPSVTGYIQQRNLHGGEAKEGGMEGYYEVLKGAKNQGVNSYLRSKIKGHLPAFRNMLSFVWKGGKVSANNPYIRNMGFLVKRTNKDLQGNTVANFGILADDGYFDANPIYIIKEILTNRDFLNLPGYMIDEASFTKAFNTLQTENLGISIYSAGYDSTDALLKEICRIINGIVIINPRTGKFEVKLARNDYDINKLLTINEDNIIDIKDYKKPDLVSLPNQITFIYDDRLTGNDLSFTMQNDAVLSANKGIINAEDIEMKAIKSKSTAERVAQRELKKRSLPLFTAEISCNRSVENVLVNDVVLWSWNDYGITDVPVRVVGVNYGNITNGIITLTVVQDVFGYDMITFSESENSQWQDPISEPAPVVNQMINSVPYYTLARYLLGDVEAEALDKHAEYISIQAQKPTQDAFNALSYLSSDNKTYTYHDGVGFCPFAITAGAITKTSTSVAILSDDIYIIKERIDEGGDIYAYINEEICSIKAVDVANMRLTIARGLLDTVPANHNANSKIFVADGYEGFDTVNKYLSDARIYCKLATRTAKGVLDLTKASVINTVLKQRQATPYNVANVRINGVFYRTESNDLETNEELKIQWETRNRLLQTAGFIEQTEGSIIAEAGQTTTIKIMKADGTVLRTITGLTSTSYTYTATDERSDAGLVPVIDDLLKTLKVEISTTRNNIKSYQTHMFTINRKSGS